MQGQHEATEGQQEQQEAPMPAAGFLYHPFFTCLEDVAGIVRDVMPKTESIEAQLQARGPDTSLSFRCMHAAVVICMHGTN